LWTIKSEKSQKDREFNIKSKKSTLNMENASDLRLRGCRSTWSLRKLGSHPGATNRQITVSIRCKGKKRVGLIKRDLSLGSGRGFSRMANLHGRYPKLKVEMSRTEGGSMKLEMIFAHVRS
jgi:hypothetical protein